MGTIIEFPASATRRAGGDSPVEALPPATIVILPVVRIERHASEPTDGGPEASETRGRGRRRRARS